MASRTSRLAAFCALTAILAALSPTRATGAAIVLSNRTNDELTIQMVDSAGKTHSQIWRPTETRSIRVDGAIQISSPHLDRGYRLEPLGVYYVAGKQGQPLSIGQIELPNFAVAAGAAGERASNQPENTVIDVALFADDEEPRRDHLWQKRLQDRMAAASEIFKSHCFVEFRVVSFGRWDSDDSNNDFNQSLAEFEREATPGPARLVIGFSSQFQLVRGRTHLGGTRGALGTHLLMREWSQVMTEAERLEVLVHELGHFLGASHSPEVGSAMRPVLGDRLARARSFRIGFDPVNTMAMCLVSDQLAAGPRTRLADLDQETRRQLEAIYRVLAQAMPDDPAANQFVALLRQPARVDISRAARRIVDAVRGAAAVVSKNRQASSDALTETYVRAAAAEASRLAPAEQRPALLLGLAVALDRTDVLRRHPIAGAVCRAIESDADRQTRLAVLGQPTMHGREDLLQHFAVSAGLTAIVGSVAAESIGLSKERRDAETSSGFSFADYQADLAGIRFAKAIIKGKLTPAVLARQFSVSALLPPPDGLVEGLDWAKFTERYGSLADARFLAERAKIVKAIEALPELSASSGNPAR